MRVKINELSLKRIYNAILRRLAALPYKISWSFSKKGIENRKSLTQFKNLHSGERCYLVANGPSLKQMDLSFLENSISFGLNRIYLAYDDMNFKNNYLVSINNLVLTQFKDEIQKLNMPKFLNWENKASFKQNNSIYYVYKSFAGNNFGVDMSKSLNPAATVTYAALQIIYYMGFSEVIIIGMDHNFETKNKNRPNETEVRDEEVDNNHFHPNYFPKGSKWETPDLISSEYFYKIARKQFENDGRKIFDCTINGKCQVFEKRKISDFNNLIQN
jgi:hypothetical protein